MSTQLQSQNIEMNLPADIGDLSGFSHIDSTGLLVNTPRNQISIAGKLLTYKNSDGSQTPAPSPMKVVILNVSPFQGKTLYEKTYEQDGDTKPSCSSANGKAPDAWIENPKANNCQTCPYSQPGSKAALINNKLNSADKTKACGDRRWIAVLPADKTNPPVPYALSMPVTSIISFKHYVNDLTKVLRLRGSLTDPKAIAPLELFTTTLSFQDRDENNQPLSFPRLAFSYDSMVPRSWWPLIKQLGTSDEVKKLIGIDEASLEQHRLPVDKTTIAAAKPATQAAFAATPLPEARTQKEDIPFSEPAKPATPMESGFAKPPVQSGFGASPFAPMQPANPAAAFGQSLAAQEVNPSNIEDIIDGHLSSSSSSDGGFPV